MEHRYLPSNDRGWRKRRLWLLLVLPSVLAILSWRAWPPGDTDPPPVAGLPAAPDVQPAPPGAVVQEDPSDGEDLAPAVQAEQPALLSDDTNLSFARRAGLHRAENPLRLTASAAIVVDAESGETLFARNDTAILPIASLTKLVTAMVLLDSGASLRQRITIADVDVDRLRHSRSRLRVGTRLARGEALRLALMSSENRAAHALARTHPAGLEAFVRQMNAKAREIGAAHATFADPTGLSNANRATARDVAAIVAAAAKYPLLRQYSTTSRHVGRYGKRRLTYLNSNRLVRLDRWPVSLQKTGYIVEAGWCLAMTLRVAGRPVNVVLLDAGSVRHRGEDARKLRRWLAKGAPGK